MRGLERERRERMIGNEMKTNKVHNIMIIVAYIYFPKGFSRPFGESESREMHSTLYTCDASTLLYCIIIDCG